MCAIAGIFDLSIRGDILQEMISTMVRRGPDESGIWKDGPCAMVHTRLAVIDPAGGKQPMELNWAGEQYVIVYNGELYNARELRQILLSYGHTFYGHSDTEVVLHAYAQWKDACLDHFNGIFAFAVWEKGSKELFLARDRMGVKPLFYKCHDDGLLFASEIKTILRYPTVSPELDGEGAMQLLMLGPGRLPGSGIFRGIQELEPGWCAYYRHGKLSKRRYWKLTDGENRDSFPETVEKVHFLVTDAIRRQMVSDVPIGAFLSGGLDSSLICSVLSREMKNGGTRLDTFSVDYLDNEKYFIPGKFQPNSDGYYIRKMEQYLDCRHHWTVLTPTDLIDALEDATRARDLPGMADVDFSLLAFCGKIRQHVTVALSGECADEIFCGYPWYRDPEVRALDGFPWAQNTKYRLSFLHPDLREKLDGEDFVREAYHTTLKDCDILPGTSAQERRMKEMVNFNQRWFMQTLLDRKDRMSMYHGLEVRVPFCDHRIAEYLYTVPWEYKDYQGKEKGLLRCAMKPYLPEEVLWRKKSPYPKTWHPAYLDLVSKKLRELIDNHAAPIHGLVSKEALLSLLDTEYAWPWYGQLMKLPQTIAYMLQIDFWMREYGVTLV